MSQVSKIYKQQESQKGVIQSIKISYSIIKTLKSSQSQPLSYVEKKRASSLISIC